MEISRGSSGLGRFVDPPDPLAGSLGSPGEAGSERSNDAPRKGSLGACPSADFARRRPRKGPSRWSGFCTRRESNGKSSLGDHHRLSSHRLGRRRRFRRVFGKGTTRNTGIGRRRRRIQYDGKRRRRGRGRVVRQRRTLHGGPSLRGWRRVCARQGHVRGRRRMGAPFGVRASPCN